jgi:hypothetical protein
VAGGDEAHGAVGIEEVALRGRLRRTRSSSLSCRALTYGRAVAVGVLESRCPAARISRGSSSASLHERHVHGAAAGSVGSG